MSVRVIADPGSCHLGSLRKAMELVTAAADSGAWAIKFQLFPKRYEQYGNMMLLEEWFMNFLMPHAKLKGIHCFASVFSESAYRCTLNSGCKYIKFAFGRYNMMKSAVLEYGKQYVFASGNEKKKPPVKCNWLYCVPEYPVKGKINFTGLFDGSSIWCGFSDHTLGATQTKRAIDAGASYIEKHLRLGTRRDNIVPDGKFAVTPKQLAEICKYGM